MLAPDADDPALAEENDFRYHREDARGARCPVASHIRRSNPRDSLDPNPGSDDSLELNRRHRLLRRGREYGSSLTTEEALQGEDDGEPRGLHFICLSGNIARQFEFVQQTWLNNPKFDGLYDDADPLVGPSEPYGGCFTAPGDGIRERYTERSALRDRQGRGLLLHAGTGGAALPVRRRRAGKLLVARRLVVLDLVHPLP